MGGAVKVALAFIAEKVIPAVIGAGIALGIAYWFFLRGQKEIKKALEHQKEIIAQLDGKVRIIENEILDMKKDIAELKIDKKLPENNGNDTEKEKMQKALDSFEKQLKDLDERYKKDAAQYKQWKLEMGIQYGEIRLKFVEITERLKKEQAAVKELSDVTKEEFSGKRKEIAEKLKKSVERTASFQNLLDETEKKLKELPRTAEAHVSKNTGIVPKTHIYISKKAIQIFRDNGSVSKVAPEVLENILKSKTVQKIIVSDDYDNEQIIAWVNKLAEDYEVPFERL